LFAWTITIADAADIDDTLDDQVFQCTSDWYQSCEANWSGSSTPGDLTMAHELGSPGHLGVAVRGAVGGFGHNLARSYALPSTTGNNASFTLFARAATGDPTVRVMIQYRNAQHQVVASVTSEADLADGEATDIHLTHALPSTATSMTVVIGVRTDTAVAWFDRLEWSAFGDSDPASQEECDDRAADWVMEKIANCEAKNGTIEPDPPTCAATPDGSGGCTFSGCVAACTHPKESVVLPTGY